MHQKNNKLYSEKNPTFCFVLGYGQLTNNVVTVSGKQRRNSAIHIGVSIFSAKLPSHPAATQHRAEFPVLYSRSLLVIHFKNSSVYMLIPSSLTIPSPILPHPCNHKFSCLSL